MNIAPHLESALSDWRSTLDSESVSTAPEVLDRYARTTGIHATRPAAVLFPRSTDDTVSLVKIASRHQVPLHPISKGKNWGYGDATPPGADQVIVDFARMNRILELNRESAYVIVEPGVTQGQLAQCLAENGGSLWMDSTGAGPEASLVGNALDRGFGHTRYGDHFQTCCGLQIVLADGRVLETGFGHFKEARARWVFRYGIGPFLDGIFSQSNFGIVTRMGLWLMPAPESFRAFFFSTPDDAKISELVDRLSPLKKQGLLPSAVHIANDLRALSSRLQYPWDRAAGATPLPAAVRAELRREHGIGAWNGCGALMGPKTVIAAVERKIKSALKSYYNVFLDDQKLALGARVVDGLSHIGLAGSLGERLKIVRPIYDMLKGLPSNDAIRGTAWRVRTPVAEGASDPLEFHAGILWVSPVIPMIGSEVSRLLALMEPIYNSHGFDCLATLTLLTDRTISCVTNIAFDRREPDDLRRADLCHRELMGALLAQGYIPYRASPSLMGQIASEDSVFWQVSRELKHALDPAGIISPGRYIQPPGKSG
jgi:4-cresol dehydrogenase (hydroxylating) flavoprotein subunit